ncbi:MAG: hypothetical protein WD467_02325 [Candidatus Saccharimonadales bacterium]
MTAPENQDIDSTKSAFEDGMEEPASIEELPHNLGFIETAELRQRKAEWLAARDTEYYRQAAITYHELAQDLVDQQSGEARMKAQIGLIIEMGLIRRSMGKMEAYLEDVEDAIVYAQQEGLDEVVAILESEARDKE